MTHSEVILLAHGFQPEYEAGYANGLVRNGMKVTLISSDDTLIDRLEPSVHCFNLRGSQRPDRSRIKKIYNLLRYFLAYWFLLFKRRGTPVHVIGQFSTTSLWVSLVEAWITSLMTRGYILTVHNLRPHDRHTLSSTWLSYWIYRSARYLMVHTERMRQELCRSFSLELDRAVVVEHGIDKLLPDLGEARQRMRKQLSIEMTERVILFFGNIVRYKGVDVLLKAFEQTDAQSAHRLLIAGRCRDRSLLTELQTLIRINRRREAILWQNGFVDQDDVAPLFHAADVLVLPYRHIDQSGVLFMAFATGLRVIATDVGSFRDYLENEFGAIVPVEDPAALASSIKKVLEPTEKSVSYDAQHFLWQFTVRPILPLYAQLRRRS